MESNFYQAQPTRYATLTDGMGLQYTVPTRSHTVAVVLALVGIVLPIGLHNFYLRKPDSAVGQILLTILFFPLSMLWNLIAAIGLMTGRVTPGWGFVDVIAPTAGNVRVKRWKAVFR